MLRVSGSPWTSCVSTGRNVRESGLGIAAVIRLVLSIRISPIEVFSNSIAEVGRQSIMMKPDVLECRQLVAIRSDKTLSKKCGRYFRRGVQVVGKG